MTVPDFENSELEKLAQMVAGGFEAVDKRSDDIDARSYTVDACFETVDKRFDEIDARFDEVDARFAPANAEIRSLRDNAQRLEAKVDAGFKSVREDIDALPADHFPVSAQTELRKRVERLEDGAGLPHSLRPASA